MQYAAQDAVEQAAEGFRFTQGWGSVGTIVVALVALVVSAHFNRRTLGEADGRHEVQRRDDYNDHVRNAAVDIATACMEWMQIDSAYRTGLEMMLDARTAGNRVEEQLAEQFARTKDNEFFPAERRMRSALYSMHLLTRSPHIDPHISAMLHAVDKLRPIINGIEYPDDASVRSGREMLEAKSTVIREQLAHVVNNTREHFPFTLPDPAERKRRFRTA
ncbi:MULTISPECIES: hypothetical protein [Nocardiaceae]|uniref:DUF4129 domain-containing protein n=1 Tax=Rhodococcoides kroppenstedtii TaxID=293050 RepID=A0ABS7NTD4_9NOCA|nr:MULTISPECIES: hypothetical protein [Rhodococcus]AMY20726.1 hypothetical protein A3Q40_03365 [Rhodococcus sp. PBTS 1]MBY6313384.1 hypothetical protein [Rhodococcus kroppenstedtii]MBY6321274.1 hypothetical protein [Rhodococcus kroppenstedtii]MBY6400308.1 hypothetical protein [Rhodococcus kroppenstedtii]